MTAARTIRAARVVVAGLLVALLIPAGASARNTTGYHVYNLTSTPLTLSSIEVAPGFDDSESAPIAPQVGDVLKPGVDPGHNHIEIKYRTAFENFAWLNYQGPSGYVRAFLQDGECDECVYHPHATCPDFTLNVYGCKTVDEDTVFIEEMPGRTHEVTGDDVQKQAEVLRQLCTPANAKSDLVTCKFKPTHRDLNAFGSPHLVGGVIPNCTSREVVHPIREKDAEGTTNSWGIKFGVEISEGAIFETAKESIDVEYGGEHTTEHEFTNGLDVPVPPYHIGWVEGVNPVVRYTGDYLLKIGGTTWNLRGVYFDYPDPTRAGQVNWRPREKKMTEEQVKAECGGPIPQSEGPQGALQQTAPASWATIAQRGTNRSEALDGGRESTTLIARGGNDVLRGGAGNDRLFGGPGNDAFHGGQGADTIVDHSGRSRVWTGAGGPSGRDVVDVRDGAGDDRVVCGKGQATVKADPGDRVRHCGR